MCSEEVFDGYIVYVFQAVPDWVWVDIDPYWYASCLL